MNDVQVMGPPMGRYYSPVRVINPTPSYLSSCQNPADFSLRDKSRLLQLAEKVQTTSRKNHQNNSSGISSLSSASNQNQYQSQTLGHRRISSSTSTNPSVNKAPLDVQSQNVFNGQVTPQPNRRIKRTASTNANFQHPPPVRYSNSSAGCTPQSIYSKSSSNPTPKFKLYSSFSTKNRIKSDPAKTNIEHLVKRNNNCDSSSSSTSSNSIPYSNGISSTTSSKSENVLMSPLKQFKGAIHASFHDKSKLAGSFNPKNLLSRNSNHGNENDYSTLTKTRSKKNNNKKDNSNPVKIKENMEQKNPNYKNYSDDISSSTTTDQHEKTDISTYSNTGMHGLNYSHQDNNTSMISPYSSAAGYESVVKRGLTRLNSDLETPRILKQIKNSIPTSTSTTNGHGHATNKIISGDFELLGDLTSYHNVGYSFDDETDFINKQPASSTNYKVSTPNPRKIISSAQIISLNHRTQNQQQIQQQQNLNNGNGNNYNYNDGECPSKKPSASSSPQNNSAGNSNAWFGPSSNNTKNIFMATSSSTSSSTNPNPNSNDGNNVEENAQKDSKLKEKLIHSSSKNLHNPLFPSKAPKSSHHYYYNTTAQGMANESEMDMDELTKFKRQIQQNQIQEDRRIEEEGGKLSVDSHEKSQDKNHQHDHHMNMKDQRRIVKKDNNLYHNDNNDWGDDYIKNQTGLTYSKFGDGKHSSCSNGTSSRPKINYKSESFRKVSSGNGSLAPAHLLPPQSQLTLKDYPRKRSRSLPKSFLSVKNGIRNLNSLWPRDELLLQESNKPLTEVPDADEVVIAKILEEKDRKSSCSLDHQQVPVQAQVENYDESTNQAVRMRWQVQATNQQPTKSKDKSVEGRPKSMLAQRKSWLTAHRDMEVKNCSTSTTPTTATIPTPIKNSGPSVSSKSSSSNPTKVNLRSKESLKRNKDSITHLHLIQDKNSSEEITLEPLKLNNHLEIQIPRNHNSRLLQEEESPKSLTSTGSSNSSSGNSSGHSGGVSSLFQRFSKSFSLRFGSGNHKAKGSAGSSPDLFRIHNDKDSKRKGSSKFSRDEKCHSGDSGIQIDQNGVIERHRPRLRRIQSEFIDSSTANLINGCITSSSNCSGPPSKSSSMKKLSLVEIPDNCWDQNNSIEHENRINLAKLKMGHIYYDNDNEDEEQLHDDDGFVSDDHGEDSITILGKVTPPTNAEKLGYYHSLPASYSKKQKKKLLDNSNSVESSGSSSSSAGDHTLPADNETRGKVILEIISTETNYVRLLSDIFHGFLVPCRLRRDLFTDEVLENIFSNIEQILHLHARFLEMLKSKLNKEMSKSTIGNVFNIWAEKFDLYAEYCCNNPISMLTVRNLMLNTEYCQFFEACRRLQVMDKLPLHGFLLRPIQRICQYHLQIQELLKHTDKSHEDYEPVVEALETMKKVATKINDTQRKFESLQDVIRLQASIDGFEGRDLLDKNAVILNKGELVKMTEGKKHKEVYVILLNKELIYCRRDFLKRNGLVYGGKIDLDHHVWLNIDSNEEDEYFGMVHNSWRIYSTEKSVWVLFTASSPAEKKKWINALESTAEDIYIDSRMKQMAKKLSATDSQTSLSLNGSSNTTSTLPKSKKSNSSNGKRGSSSYLKSSSIDSADAMLIEVGKLKEAGKLKLRAGATSQNIFSSQKERTSKFYI